MRRPAGKVRVIQYLCPQRHCIIAGAYVAGESTRTEVEQDLLEKCRVHALHLHCGICGSTELFFDDQPTPWNSMEEALPILREGQRRQALTRAVLDALGQTVDGPGSGGTARLWHEGQEKEP